MGPPSVEEGPLFGFLPSAQVDADPAQLQEQGWRYFKVFAGPAAGPKNFVTCGLDHQLQALSEQGQLQGERWLLGGSMAALRFCALATGGRALDRLIAAFTNMMYHKGDTSAVLSGMMRGLFDIAAPDPSAVVHHPTWRLAIMVTALQPWATLLPEWQLKTLFYGYLAANVASARVLASLQRRVLFYSGPHPPPWLPQEEDILCVPLTHHNLHQVLHATTCLPFVSERCEYVTGLGRGVYYDGALSDYTLNMRLSDPDWPCLMLGAVCAGEPIKATVWDAYVPWRSAQADPSLFRHVSVVAPLSAYANALPTRALPDTWDFFKPEYMKAPEKRRAAWHHAFHLSTARFPHHPLDAAVLPRPGGGGHESRSDSGGRRRTARGLLHSLSARVTHSAVTTASGWSDKLAWGGAAMCGASVADRGAGNEGLQARRVWGWLSALSTAGLCAGWGAPEGPDDTVTMHMPHSLSTSVLEVSDELQRARHVWEAQPPQLHHSATAPGSDLHTWGKDSLDDTSSATRAPLAAALRPQGMHRQASPAIARFASPEGGMVQGILTPGELGASAETEGPCVNRNKGQAAAEAGEGCMPQAAHDRTQGPRQMRSSSSSSSWGYQLLSVLGVVGNGSGGGAA